VIRLSKQSIVHRPIRQNVCANVLVNFSLHHQSFTAMNAEKSGRPNPFPDILWYFLFTVYISWSFLPFLCVIGLDAASFACHLFSVHYCPIGIVLHCVSKKFILFIFVTCLSDLIWFCYFLTKNIAKKIRNRNMYTDYLHLIPCVRILPCKTSDA